MVPGFKAKQIKPTKTVGQRLQTARKKMEMSLEEAERLTKVKLKYLEALEEDRHDLLPTEVYSLGFLRCYGEVLGLNTTRLLDQYRAERQTLKTAKGQTPQALAPARRLNAPRFLLTPVTLITSGSIILVVGLMVYIGSGIRGFLAPPTLRIDQPVADSKVVDTTLKASGKTDPAVTLTINGEFVSVDAEGNFSYDIAVVPGLNRLEFVAMNRIGKESKQSRTILADYQVSPSPIVTPSPQPSPSPSPSPTGNLKPSPTNSLKE
jgi:hypothetical protein